MTDILRQALAMFVGLSGGLAVGCGFVAFITVLDIIPRLSQLLNRVISVRILERAVIWGVMTLTLLDFWEIRLRLFKLGVVFLGLLHGMFVGMLAGALTEVLNVFPILAKRLRLNHYLFWLLMAMVFGKVIGSLFDWIVYQQL